MFNENLHSLFERRVLASKDFLDTLEYEWAKLHNRQALI
jgi:hypothetical protein